MLLEMQQKFVQNQALIDTEESQDAIIPENSASLLQEIRMLRAEIAENELNLTNERELFNEALAEKDLIIAKQSAEIEALKIDHPGVLAQSESNFNLIHYTY
jgi:hypothetical protein